ncbi:MAG: c-type cytochrome [Planctomycetes bacterium]|nr:c-type cytochrome [Planctomycetota bacterium]
MLNSNFLVKVKYLQIILLSLLSLGACSLQAATPAHMNIKEGFNVELIYTVPKEEQGSWVSMCVDDRGRLIVSDQYGALYRVTVPPPGHEGSAQVEELEVNMGHCQGLLYAFDSLYATINGKEHGGRGLYRLEDTTGDDQFDKITLLKKFEEQGGEHGPHAVVLGPEGKSIYVVVGDQTALPEYDISRVPPVWQEDQLLPRIYGRGFMKGVLAPRGWIAKTDPDGKYWEIIATGFRNEYDAAFNREGELFTFDADMEWDLNTPWYRPTRVCHVVSGAEFGWRNGSGKWPVYYADSLPPVVDIGPGSPTGVCFGYGAKFPAKYQEAFYISDWSYGKLYAVHLKPKGSTYEAEFEEFLSGSPLPLTDLVVNPKDESLYFTVGGRRVQSALYRVTYTGNESTERSLPNRAGARERALRHRLEALHARGHAEAVEVAWPRLKHTDRFVRYAARVAIEHQDPAAWQEKALREQDSDAALAGLMALARVGDMSLQPRVLQALAHIDYQQLGTDRKLELIRIYALTFIRMGAPDEAQRKELIARFDPVFPANTRELNSELCMMMVYLQAPGAAAKGVALLEEAPTQEEQIDLARSLRLLRGGWTPKLQERYFSWFHRAAHYRGGASFGKFVDYIRNDALDGLSAADKLRLKPILDASPEPAIPTGSVAAMEILGARDFFKEWTVADLAPNLQSLQGRDFDRGRSMFGAVGCFNCHRFGTDGGSVGPDLTGAGGRFSAGDLLESIIEPSKEISDQYGAITITMIDDTQIVGRIANLSGDGVSVMTDMYNPGQMRKVDRKQIKSIEPSKVSMMPSGLLDLLKEQEIQDLLAYLLSRGDRDHAMFK